ncbi:hypothetical protein AVL59_19390 [Streptomyces griseochromogenes]|uniref:Uncharacterized protein n=1 Tax=Streptomyces griseochromogenes TaxID=68214 RepID=A0A1B1AY85_9ACTN|nr:hypothetical protein AVL59_19390 [Streptomyces griseochromogenes]
MVFLRRDAGGDRLPEGGDAFGDGPQTGMAVGGEGEKPWGRPRRPAVVEDGEDGGGQGCGIGVGAQGRVDLGVDDCGRGAYGR